MNLEKMILNINGVDRMFIYNPEKDSLADVLRRIGLTSVKIGCGMGACGSCSVILDGKLVRSCVKKIKMVPQYSKVITVEGIGTPQHLHPLQIAFMHCGAVHCGFCTPGFIVSSYALLSENLNPTREEVRDWFQKHRNACRCTGYKQIVDAVIVASKILRGEETSQNIMFKEPSNGEYYGKPVVRPGSIGKVCGLTDYGEDIAMKMPTDTLHAVLVLPRLTCHAYIKSLDIKEAEMMPGVVKVVTYKDVKGTNRLESRATLGLSTTITPKRTIFCEDKIIRYGDCVAAVVADTEEHARVAVEKVKIEIKQLPEYHSLLESCQPDSIQIHKDTSNLIGLQPKLKGMGLESPCGVENLIDNSAYAVEASFYTPPQPHLTIEGDTVQSYWDREGNITIQCKSQSIYGNIEAIGVAIGIDDEKLRIILNPAGGSFGWATSPGSYAIAAACSMAVNKAIALHINYEEHQCFSGKRSASYANSMIGCDKNGKITGAVTDIAFDHGAYREWEIVIGHAVRFCYTPYYIPNIVTLGRIYNTNNAFGTAYRGFGAPQAYTCSESMVDILAEKAGIDPFEFRWRNIARGDETNTSGFPYRCYPMEEIMIKMRPYYEKAVSDAKMTESPEKRRGVGLSWGGTTVSTGASDSAIVVLELNSDGSITKYDTWQDVGQGGDIGSLMVTVEALKPLNIKPENIRLVQNDNKYCPNSGSSTSSRSHFMNSNATKLAADRLIGAMKKPDGSWRTYNEMIEDGIPTKFEAKYSNSTIPNLVEIDPNTGVGDNIPVYNYMLFMAEVEVDVKTGRTTVLRFVCIDDVGKVGNIDVLNGQAYSGISHGIGFALSENYYDDKKHNNIASCGFPYIKAIPDNIVLIHCENLRKENVFGSSGAAEGYQSSSHMAVINAIYNACGVRIYELPATPEKVKEGLNKLATSGKIEPPAKYSFGTSIFEELDHIKTNKFKGGIN